MVSRNGRLRIGYFMQHHVDSMDFDVVCSVVDVADVSRWTKSTADTWGRLASLAPFAAEDGLVVRWAKVAGGLCRVVLEHAAHLDLDEPPTT